MRGRKQQRQQQQRIPLSNLVGTGFASQRFADDHESVPDDHHFVDLLNLLQEEVGALEIHLLAVLPDVMIEDFVVRLGQNCAREKIAGDPTEQRKVVCQELRQIHVSVNG